MIGIGPRVTERMPSVLAEISTTLRVLREDAIDEEDTDRVAHRVPLSAIVNITKIEDLTDTDLERAGYNLVRLTEDVMRRYGGPDREAMFALGFVPPLKETLAPSKDARRQMSIVFAIAHNLCVDEAFARCMIKRIHELTGIGPASIIPVSDPDLVGNLMGIPQPTVSPLFALARTIIKSKTINVPVTTRNLTDLQTWDRDHPTARPAGAPGLILRCGRSFTRTLAVLIQAHCDSYPAFHLGHWLTGPGKTFADAHLGAGWNDSPVFSHLLFVKSAQDTPQTFTPLERYMIMACALFKFEVRQQDVAYASYTDTLRAWVTSFPIEELCPAILEAHAEHSRVGRHALATGNAVLALAHVRAASLTNPRFLDERWPALLSSDTITLTHKDDSLIDDLIKHRPEWIKTILPRVTDKACMQLVMNATSTKRMQLLFRLGVGPRVAQPLGIPKVLVNFFLSTKPLQLRLSQLVSLRVPPWLMNKKVWRVTRITQMDGYDPAWDTTGIPNAHMVTHYPTTQFDDVSRLANVLDVWIENMSDPHTCFKIVVARWPCAERCTWDGTRPAHHDEMIRMLHDVRVAPKQRALREALVKEIEDRREVGDDAMTWETTLAYWDRLCSRRFMDPRPVAQVLDVEPRA